MSGGPTDPAAPRRGRILALAGAAALAAAQPPIDAWVAAWVAPVPWLLLVRAPGSAATWRMLWLAGFLHWLAVIHWLRLPHPATSIGWVVLSAYLACYVPAFVWLARRLVHRWRWPLVAAAPAAWMALEQLRGWVLGGFTFAALGHTQWRWTTLIQLADAGGAVGVSGVVVAGAAAVASLVPGAGRVAPREAIAAVAAAAALVAATLGYGTWRLATAPASARPPLDVLLVQGSIDTELKHDPEAAGDVARHYDDITRAGLEAGGRPPDLVVWPETMWRWGLVEIAAEESLDEEVVARLLGPQPDGADAAARADRQARARAAVAAERLDALATFARRYGTWWLVGLDRQRITPRAAGGAEHFNTALLLDPDGGVVACYDKMYPVMFGEYIPLADRFPFLYRLTPLPAGLTAGTTPVAAEVAGYRIAPTICYETALPDAIRDIVRRLARDGRRPDVIVNLTNDGWFWGSSELDMHLTAAVFRAVEVRTPLVIAANTGFSAAIDGSGRLLARGPRRDTQALRVAVRPDGRWSPWLAAGTLPTGLCLAVAVAVAVEAVLREVGRRRMGGAGGSGRESLERA